MRRFWAMVWGSLGVVVLDAGSKAWILRHFELGESRALTPFFHLTYVQNTGTAFGMFHGQNKALTVVGFLVLGMLVYAARGVWERAGSWGVTGLALVAGGAMGNLIDRIRWGWVVDFLDFRVWPVFNVADSCITIGAGLILIGLWRKG